MEVGVLEEKIGGSVDLGRWSRAQLAGPAWQGN